MKTVKIVLCLFALLMLPGTSNVLAQHLPKGKKVANIKRPNNLKVSVGDLNRFYEALFEEKVNFTKMKLAKADQAYYLLAENADNGHIFAFELKQKGKKLRLDPHLVVHCCDNGSLELRTFLQADGKISGCKLGVHTMKVWQERDN